MRGPSYVLFVALLYRLAGHGPLVPLVAQAVLDSISCLVVFLITRRVFGRVGIAFTAAAIYALYPPIIQQSGWLLSEVFVNFLILGAVAMFLKYTATGRPRALILSALAVGVCALTKPHMAPLPVVFAIAALPQAGWRRAGRDLAIQLTLVALVLSPWIVRNAVVLHSFVPGVSLGGVTFWGGTGPANGRTLGGTGGPLTPPHVKTAIAGMSEVERDRWLYQEGVRVIQGNPGRYSLLLVRKALRLWFNLGFDDPPSKASLAFALFGLAAMTLAVAGTWLMRPDPVATRLAVILVIYFTLVHVSFFAVGRYALPVYAYLFCFTAAGIVALGARMVRPRLEDETSA
jgi:4-amino-4-deoxy-L-arabinose transferase-like glycosyltransferase